MWMISCGRILTLDAKKGYNLPKLDGKIQCEMSTNKMYIKKGMLCAVRFSVSMGGNNPTKDDTINKAVGNLF